MTTPAKLRDGMIQKKTMTDSATAERRLIIKGIDPMAVFGAQDSNLRLLEAELGTQLIARGQEIIVRGAPERVQQAEKVLNELIFLANRNGLGVAEDIETVTRLSELGQKGEAKADADSEQIIVYTKTGFIKPRTEGQQAYLNACRANDIVFSIGPAGTGKTFMAVALAVAALRDKIVDRIVLCRPAVEAGESLGFLPGDFREKVDPYLRPLYDALYDMVPADKLKRFIETRIIEIVPLAYMRGRTLNNAFVILDEAQNTTSLQMKMFLTRLGNNSKAIITGDITQIDLPEKLESGLVQIQNILQGIEGIGFIYLSERDVVRHHLVRKIIKAYEKLS